MIRSFDKLVTCGMVVWQVVSNSILRGSLSSQQLTHHISQVTSKPIRMIIIFRPVFILQPLTFVRTTNNEPFWLGCVWYLRSKRRRVISYHTLASQGFNRRYQVIFSTRDFG